MRYNEEANCDEAGLDITLLRDKALRATKHVKYEVEVETEMPKPLAGEKDDALHSAKCVSIDVALALTQNKREGCENSGEHESRKQKG